MAFYSTLDETELLDALVPEHRRARQEMLGNTVQDLLEALVGGGSVMRFGKSVLRRGLPLLRGTAEDALSKGVAEFKYHWKDLGEDFYRVLGGQSANSDLTREALMERWIPIRFEGK